MPLPSDDRLYEEIVRVEDSLAEQRRYWLDANGAWRAEVDELSADAAALQDQLDRCRCEAEAVRALELSSAARHRKEADALRLRLQAAQRGTQATKALSARMRRYQCSAESLHRERAELEHEGEVECAAWEESVEALHAVASRVEALEKEERALEVAGGSWGAAASRSEVEMEARALFSERAGFLKELREATDAQELKSLMDKERSQLISKHVSATTILDDIADIEEGADVIELRSQRIIGDLRAALERGAAEKFEVQVAARRTDEWLQSMSTALGQQQQEHSSLQHRRNDEDLWALHLQAQIDALVQELRDLEQDMRGYTRGPSPMPAEAALEEDLWRAHAVLRQQRREAQHSLVCQLARQKPLRAALHRVEQEQQALLAQLQPLLPLLSR